MYYIKFILRKFVELFAEGLRHSDTQTNPGYGTDMYVPNYVNQGNNYH